MEASCTSTLRYIFKFKFYLREKKDPNEQLRAARGIVEEKNPKGIMKVVLQLMPAVWLTEPKCCSQLVPMHYPFNDFYKYSLHLPFFFTALFIYFTSLSLKHSTFFLFCQGS